VIDANIERDRESPFGVCGSGAGIAVVRALTIRARFTGVPVSDSISVDVFRAVLSDLERSFSTWSLSSSLALDCDRLRDFVAVACVVRLVTRFGWDLNAEACPSIESIFLNSVIWMSLNLPIFPLGMEILRPPTDMLPVADSPATFSSSRSAASLTLMRRASSRSSSIIFCASGPNCGPGRANLKSNEGEAVLCPLPGCISSKDGLMWSVVVGVCAWQ